MKRFISLVLAILTLTSLFCLTSCSEPDIDLRDKENVYDDLATFINAENGYDGNTVALTSTYTVVYDFSQNKIIRHTLSEFDTTGEKRALYEIRKEDKKYPAVGSRVTVNGTLHKDGYIKVKSFKNAEKALKVDFDTLELSAYELKEFVGNYRTQYKDSEYYGKTIRIFGHLAADDKGYHYLIGLDSNGAYSWEMELYDPEEEFEYPTAEGNTVNPVEIIGELSTYVDNDIMYSCIKVKRVGRAESVFKENLAQ